MKEQMESLITQMIEQGIAYEDAMHEFEKKFIKRVLEKNQGNQSKTAHSLGIHRNTLSRKIEEMELNGRSKRRG